MSAIAYVAQVLTGEIPFRGVRQSELGWSVVQGLRPIKPENSSSIGFSNVLWSFTQRCWDGDPKLRPEVAEVVTYIGEAVANWEGLMPPCAPAELVAEDAASNSGESDSMTHRELETFTLA